MPSSELLVFTDLDGTLLNHSDYGFSAAIPTLRRLEEAGIPVIPATSKTRAEMLEWRREVDNRHPLIVENGAAVLVPEGYLTDPPNDVVASGGFLVKAFVPPRAHWQQLLARAASHFPGCWQSFSELGVDGIMALTGLDRFSADLASRREYGEPLAWQGGAAELERFDAWMHDNGANVLVGGRFVHVSGHCDKGRALRWLAALYRRQPGAGTIATIALGDSGNDIAMLRAADHGVVVRSPAHDPLQVSIDSPGGSRILPVTCEIAPAGWVEGVCLALAKVDPGLLPNLPVQD